MRLLFIAVKGRLDARFGCFEILSLDFVLDQYNDLTPRLVDVNANPSISTEMAGSEKFISTLVRDVAKMACDLHEVGVKRARPGMLDKVFACAQQPY